MNRGAPEPGDGAALVPGELRGYRQFQLRHDGLYPLVHSRTGAWEGALHRATCAAGAQHEPPAPDCRCGLYAWYLPGSATVSLGPAPAVIAARGRCILGDRGFRAAGARIEAVALPASVRLHPPAAARARRMLQEQYPNTRVYGSVGRMLKDFPPHDVKGLGIDPPPDHSRGYRAAAVALWAVVVVVTYSLAAVPRDTLAQAATQWWPLLVLGAIAWQAVLVWLVARLLALQAPGATGQPRG